MKTIPAVVIFEAWSSAGSIPFL